MPKLGFMNPANASTGGGGSFKEGIVRIDKSVFTNHQGKEYDGVASPIVPGLLWQVTRLTEDMEPMVDPSTDRELVEDLFFGAGIKALPKLHPGNASGPDDDDTEDLGADAGVEGPTIYLVDQTFRPHVNSALMVLTKSLLEKGFKAELIDQAWAPVFEGCVFHMKSWLNPDVMIADRKTGKEQPTPYKIVDGIISTPYEKAGKKPPTKAIAAPPTKKATANAASAPAASAPAPAPAPVGDDGDVEVLTALLTGIAGESKGKTMSVKALAGKVNTAAIRAKLKAQQMKGVQELVKSAEWLEENGAEFGFALDGDNVVFGE